MSRSIKALQITPEGVVEVIEVGEHRDAIATVLSGNRDDIAVRATFEVKGGDVLTVWTQGTTKGRQLNELAGQVVEEILPPTIEGAPDRIRDGLRTVPITGPVLITGYRAGRQTPVPELQIERIRMVVDGRAARRAAARRNAAPTLVLPALDAIPGEVVHQVDEPVSDVAALADAVRRAPRTGPVTKRAAKARQR